MIPKVSFQKSAYWLAALWMAGALAERPAGAATPAHLAQGQSRESFGRHALSLGYNAVNYFYSPSSEKQPIFQSLQLQGKYETQSSWLEAKASGQLMLLVSPRAQPHFELSELNAGTTREWNRFQLHVGRKLAPWSQLDEQWKLGLFQPRFRWDYFHPESVGLSGTFASYDSKNFQVLAFASPFFIPERGVAISVVDGAMDSPTAWFVAPSSKIALFDQETRIRYHLDVPATREIILHPGGAALARLGEKEGLWVSGAYAYKPVNQLLLGHDAYLKVAPPIEVPATIRPRVIYHHLTGFETGIKATPVSFTLSAIQEIPVSTPVPANWTVQTAGNAWLAGSNLQVVTGRSRLDFGFMRRWGGNAPDVGRDANGSTSVFEPRYPFASALRAGAFTPLTSIFGHSAAGMELSSRVLYDTFEDGALWLSEFRYSPRTQWQLRFGADLLATEVFASAKPAETSFITRYKVNNRIHAGVSYVF